MGLMVKELKLLWNAQWRPDEKLVVQEGSKRLYFCAWKMNYEMRKFGCAVDEKMQTKLG
jgi:hypothetical protein